MNPGMKTKRNLASICPMQGLGMKKTRIIIATTKPCNRKKNEMLAYGKCILMSSQATNNYEPLKREQIYEDVSGDQRCIIEEVQKETE